MRDDPTTRLLGPDDPPPAVIVNRRGASPFLLLGDHAGNAIPSRLGTLGLEERDRQRHIAWDIGTAALGHRLALQMDALFLHQHYSRLIIDCNRDPGAADAAPEVSDATAIPGNERLSPVERAARVAEIHQPYQTAIASEIASRTDRGLPSILISLHSFTPCLAGRAERPWHIGVLHDRHRDAFAQELIAALKARGDLIVGDNEPYRMDATDHTVPRHAFAAGLLYAEIEVRQDLLADDVGVDRWVTILGAALRSALSAVAVRRPDRA